MLSIGGNHLIHALRRNVNLKIIMFNNQIYGLTKGQYSPTSEVGKITKSSPFGSLDTPFNPVSVALGAEATFVARTHDMDRKHMMEAFRRAHEHQGSAFVEIYQNCNVFNDGAFEAITAKEARADMLIELHHGEPIRFGADDERGVVLNEFGECEIVEVADVGEDALLVHDEHPRRPGARVRAVAPVVDRRRCRRRSACSATSSGRPTRPRCSASSSSAVGASGPRRPRRAARLRRHLGRQLARHGRRRQSSRLRNTMPVRGFGAKNVVFSGMRRPAAAAARIVSTVTGRSRTAASASPLSTSAATVARVVAVGERRRRRAGGEHAGVEARRVDVAQLARAARAMRGLELGGRERAARARRGRRGRARRSSRMAPRARRRPRARSAPAACTGTGRRARRGGRRRRRRRAGGGSARRRAASSASSTTRIMIASAPGSSMPAARRSAR